MRKVFRSLGLWVVFGVLFSQGRECLRAADCNKNGVPDATDVSNATSRDCNENAVPDECDLLALFGFDPVKKVPIGAANAIALAGGDLDGDLDLDIVTVNSDSSNVSVLRNGGNRSFTATTPP